MKIIRGSSLSKLSSGGGADFTTPSEWATATYGSGWPIAPVSPPKDTEMPRSIDYPISINATLTPRTGYGLMPFSALLEAYENVTECKIPVNLMWRVMTTFKPRLVDDDGNEVQDHPYLWMTKTPDGKTPFKVWLTRFLKSAKVYDAPAIYFDKDGDKTTALHYIDGSTLFLIVDEYGNTPDPTPMQDYILSENNKEQSGAKKSLPSFNTLTPGTPTNVKELLQMLLQRQNNKQEVPQKLPAYTQIIKGTPFSFWSSDQIWYRPQSRRMNSPYGESFIEQAWSWIMVIVNITAFELGHYRTGNMPEGFVTLPSSMYGTPDRLLLAEQLYNSRMYANPATERNRIRVFPDGTKYIPTKKPDFPIVLYTQAWKNILHTIGIPPSEFGDIPGSGLGGKGFKEGAADDLSRNTLNPNREFIMSPFNETLAADGVDDVTFDLGYPEQEINPDALKTSIYTGMAHGTYTLNDALGQLSMNPVDGSMDDEGNPILTHIANKHLIVAGANIYIVEDMQVGQGGLAQPVSQPGTGGAPADTSEGEAGDKHTPEDTKTLEHAIQNIMQYGKLSATTYSLPPTVSPESANGVDPKEFEMGMKEEQEHAATVNNNQSVIRRIVLDHLREDPQYYTHLKAAEALRDESDPSQAKTGITKVSVSIDLLKHCGVCPEDDDYFGAPISHELKFDLHTDDEASQELDGRDHANDVEIVAMCPAGLPPKPALWKPVGGENDILQERIGGAQYVREEAAYLLDRSLGFYLIPVSYVAQTSDDEVGAVIYYTFGMRKPLEANEYAPEWIERAAVLDYVMCQLDRGSKHNYAGHPDDPSRMVLYDNGLSFPANPALHCESPFTDLMVNQPLSDDIVTALQRCFQDNATWADIRNLLGNEPASTALTCIQSLIESRKITPLSSSSSGDYSPTSPPDETGRTTTTIMTDVPTS